MTVDLRPEALAGLLRRLISTAETYAMQTYDRSCVTRRLVDEARAAAGALEKLEPRTHMLPLDGTGQAMPLYYLPGGEGGGE